jgi:hypothetical protein
LDQLTPLIDVDVLLIVVVAVQLVVLGWLAFRRR